METFVDLGNLTCSGESQEAECLLKVHCVDRSSGLQTTTPQDLEVGSHG